MWFGLVSVAPFPDWLTALYEINQLLVETPRQLALFSYQDANCIWVRISPTLLILRLWQAACIAAIPPGHRGAITSEMLTDAPPLAIFIRSKNVGETGCAKGRQQGRRALNVPEGFEDMDPAKKAIQLALGDNDSRDIENFLVAGDRVDILRQAKYSLPPIASGLQ